MNYTPIDDAFHFTTTMPNKSIVKDNIISNNCIYCNHDQTYPLITEGTFRQCLNKNCRKQFQVKMTPTKQIETPSIINTRHQNDYIMFNQKQFLEQRPVRNEKSPAALEANQYQQFSHPNYDAQIKYK
jgi:hypothetical protein